jgi:hypothetical protein
MTVAEWIEKLSKLDPTQRIFIRNEHHGDFWEPEDTIHCSAEVYDTDTRTYVMVKGYEIE